MSQVSEQVREDYQLDVYDGDELVLRQRRSSWPYKLVDGVMVYVGWEVRSARLSKIFKAESEARAYRAKLASRRARTHPGGFVGAFGSLAVEPVEFTVS